MRTAPSCVRRLNPPRRCANPHRRERRARGTRCLRPPTAESDLHALGPGLMGGRARHPGSGRGAFDPGDQARPRRSCASEDVSPPRAQTAVREFPPHDGGGTVRTPLFAMVRLRTALELVLGGRVVEDRVAGAATLSSSGLCTDAPQRVLAVRAPARREALEADVLRHVDEDAQVIARGHPVLHEERDVVDDDAVVGQASARCARASGHRSPDA